MTLKTPTNLDKIPQFIADNITPSDLYGLAGIIARRIAPAVRKRIGPWAAQDVTVMTTECGNVIDKAAEILKASKDPKRRALGVRLMEWGED